MATPDYFKPSIGKFRQGSTGDPYYSYIDAPYKVVNQTSILNEIPVKNSRVAIREASTPYSEINSGVPDVLQYYVDYTTGTVKFNAAANGKTLLFTYSGRGIELIPDVRIYTQQTNGTVTQTLADLTKGASNFLFLNDYNNSTLYNYYNIVNYLGASYMYINTTSASGNLPTSTTFWAKISGSLYRGTYSAATSYDSGDVVNDSNNYKILQSLVSNNLNNPLTDATKWQLMIDVSGVANTLNTTNTNVTNAESARVTAENNRVNAESSRVSAESSRASAEPTRASNETTRQSNETTRQSQETTRQSGYTAFRLLEPYDNTHAYVPMNKVTLGGRTYQCIASTTGNTPPNATYWIIIADKGADGTGAGTVISVSSSNGDITVATPTITPTLTLNSGSGANQIVKRDVNGDIVGNITGNASTVTTNANLTGAVTSVGNVTTVASGLDAAKIGNGTVSNAEFQNLDGVTSPIQTQLNVKAPNDAPVFTTSVTLPGDPTQPLGAATRQYVDSKSNVSSSQVIALQREVANLKAVSSLKDRVDGASDYFYDLMDGLNGGSAGKIDATTTNVVGVTAIGATTVTVKTVTGLAVGQEVTLFDDVNLERPIISAINTSTKVVTFTTALTKAYKDIAQLCRSSVIQDTTNKLLKFGGWSTIGTATQTGSTVVASAYDTGGNGGRKIIQVNGNLFSVMRNGTTDFRIMKSTDNGTTTPWPTIVTVTELVNDVALATDGTYLYVLSSFTTSGAKFRKYDQSGILQGSAVNVDASQSAMGNVSIAIASDGSLHAAWSSKNATYPNSFNIRYSKSTDIGATWAAVTQITVYNTAGIDTTNPCIVVRSNNYPSIIYQQVQSSTQYLIMVQNWNGSAWSGSVTIYSPGTYSQLNPSAAIAPNGRIWVTWHGLDSTDTTNTNIRVSYSDDGGATWSAQNKLTTGNVYGMIYPSVAIDKNNNVYVLFEGVDATITTSFRQLKKIVYSSGGTWGGITLVTNNSDTVNIYASTLMDNTLDFSEPLVIYKQSASVKFRGTWIAGTITPVLVEDVRYNITPPSNVSSAVAWVDRQTDAGLSLAASLSIHSTTENFTAMTKTTSTVDGTTSEDQFTGTGTSNSKAALRVTMTRTSTSITKAITKITGAVG